MDTQMKRTMLPLGTVVLVAAAAVFTAAPAQAAARDGVCNTGEFCYYYNSGRQGSVSDFTTSVPDYGTSQPGCYEFKGPGAGKGRCIKNEAASVWNRSTKTVRVYYNSNYNDSYAFQDISAGGKVNLNAKLKNQNASHEFIGDNTTPGGCHTDGTHTRAPSTILVYRVSLNRVERVNFKTYVKNVLPNEWPASWPRESLRTGAIATKSFGWYWALHSTRKTSSGVCFDVYDTTSSQVYQPGSATAATSAAVDATWSTRLTRNGKILEAHYCSTNTACPGWVTGDWLSQYGSKDLANAGQGHRTILRHYYRNIALSG